tara:strand:- start:137 stop:364 length:228 start_codon:yes stop_codon:yes gene_type:complete
MEINKIVYCKKTGSSFRITRSCILNSIKHFELENVSNREIGKKLLAETSVRDSFETDMTVRPKNPIARFAGLLNG